MRTPLLLLFFLWFFEISTGCTTFPLAMQNVSESVKKSSYTVKSAMSNIQCKMLCQFETQLNQVHNCNGYIFEPKQDFNDKTCWLLETLSTLPGSGPVKLSYCSDLFPSTTTTTLPPPINCVGAWSDYGNCSALCGDGTKIRTYTITTPAANGGSACPAANAAVETVACNLGVCNVDCTVEWGQWSECSKLQNESFCGEIASQGQRIRTRTITDVPQGSGSPCEEAQQIQNCPCPATTTTTTTTAAPITPAPSAPCYVFSETQTGVSMAMIPSQYQLSVRSPDSYWCHLYCRFDLKRWYLKSLCTGFIFDPSIASPDQNCILIGPLSGPITDQGTSLVYCSRA